MGLATNKATGLDGFNVEFYQYFWNVIKSDLIHAVKYFFTMAVCVMSGIRLLYCSFLRKI